MKLGKLLIISVGLLILCCGSKSPNSVTPEEQITETPSSQFTEEPSQIGATDVAEVERDALNDGSISRVDLDQLLAEGPATILAMVQTEPVLNKGRFVGFRIVAFTDGPPTTVDLQVGDVVVAINSKSVERPEQFFEVIETLKKAENLELVILRNRSRQELVYPIRN